MRKNNDGGHDDILLQFPTMKCQFCSFSLSTPNVAEPFTEQGVLFRKFDAAIDTLSHTRLFERFYPKRIVWRAGDGQVR
jgi:hypothetical protein